MWQAWPSLAFLPRHRAVPRSSGRVGLCGREFGLWCKMITMMVIRLYHATLHLLLSSNEAWDSKGKHGYGRITYLSQPTSPNPAVCKLPEPPT